MSKEATAKDIYIEASLLKALTNKKNYEQFLTILDFKRLTTEAALVLKDYKKYFDKYNRDINWQEFSFEFDNWHRRDLDENDLIHYRSTVFPLIENSNEDNAYVSLLEREAGRKIEDVISKNMDEEQIQTILKELKEQKSVYNKEVDDDIFSLNNVDCSVLDASNGLRWCLSSIQASLNSLMPGQFVVVAADSDVGKSAFCISQAVYTFKQLCVLKSNKPILYCTSEDTKEDLVCRFLSNLYSNIYLRGFEEIIEEFSGVKQRFINEYIHDMFVGMSIRGPRDITKIENKISRYSPSLIVIDMLDKLSNSDNIQDLTRLYQHIRGIANDGYPIIGTSQTGNTSYQDAETKQYKHRKWLTDKDLGNSKSGKQGAAYCIISIGKDDDMPNIRYLQTTKKKRGKHVAVTCEIEDRYSLYKELM